jgi:hypothetical protein
MALDTYAGLKAEIADHLDRDDLTTQIDSFIDLAEARHKREIRFRSMQNRVQASINDRYAALPTDFLGMQTLRLLTSPITVLSEVSLHEMNRLRRESSGTPQFFTVHEEIEFDRPPGLALTAEMIYYAELSPLSDLVTTNALLEKAPDAYLYGALMAAAPFLVDDERIKTWADLYAAARDGLNTADRQSRKSGPLISRVTGATP